MTPPCIQAEFLALVAVLAWLRCNWEERSDGEIVEHVLRGQTEAYGVLVRRYGRKVYGVVRRMVSCHADADEITQEAFVRAYQSLETFDTSRRFSTWLCRIAMNLAINAAEKKRRRATESLEERAETVGFEPTGGDNPSERAERGELADAVARALAELPDGMREVFALRAFDDMSYDEIADALAIPRGTVMSRLARARERLQAALGQFVDGKKTDEAVE